MIYFTLKFIRAKKKQQRILKKPNFFFSFPICLGQYSDETKTHRRSDAFETDDENTTTGTFQANYQYTPLKEYAATKNDLTTSNGYRSKKD